MQDFGSMSYCSTDFRTNRLWGRLRGAAVGGASDWGSTGEPRGAPHRGNNYFYMPESGPLVSFRARASRTAAAFFT